MPKSRYKSMYPPFRFDRREFFKMSGTASLGLLMTRTLLSAEKAQTTQAGQAAVPTRPATNIEEALKVPRTKYSLPGLFPGKVVEVHDPKAMDSESGKPSAEVIKGLFEKGIANLTGQDLKKASTFSSRKTMWWASRLTRSVPVSSAPAWKWLTPLSNGWRRAE